MAITQKHTIAVGRIFIHIYLSDPIDGAQVSPVRPLGSSELSNPVGVDTPIISRVQGAGSCSCDMLGIVTSREQEQESGMKLLSTIVRPPGTNHMPPGTTTCHDNTPTLESS
jgi:hypothetical protein